MVMREFKNNVLSLQWAKKDSATTGSYEPLYSLFEMKYNSLGVYIMETNVCDASSKLLQTLPNSETAAAAATNQQQISLFTLDRCRYKSNQTLFVQFDTPHRWFGHLKRIERPNNRPSPLASSHPKAQRKMRSEE
jgi:hypothetical protein